MACPPAKLRVLRLEAKHPQSGLACRCSRNTLDWKKQSLPAALGQIEFSRFRPTPQWHRRRKITGRLLKSAQRTGLKSRFYSVEKYEIGAQ